MQPKVDNDLQQEFKQIIKEEIKRTSSEKENPTVKDYVDAISEKITIAGQIYSASIKQQEAARSQRGRSSISVDLKDIAFSLSSLGENGAYSFTKEKQIARLIFVPVKSSWIKTIGYDYNNQILYVAFKKAAKDGRYDFYRYFNISVSEYASVLMQTSRLKNITKRSLEVFSSDAKDGFQRLGKYDNAIKGKIENEDKDILSSILSYKKPKQNKQPSSFYEKKIPDYIKNRFNSVGSIFGKDSIELIINFFKNYYIIIKRDMFATSNSIPYEEAKISDEDRRRFLSILSTEESYLMKNIKTILFDDTKTTDKKISARRDGFLTIEQYAIKDIYGVE